MSAPDLCYATEQEEAKKDSIRVVFPIQEGMSEIDENGNYTGYTYDYLQRIAQFTDWEYEFITFDDMDEDEALMKAMEMVKNGEADIMGCMLKLDGMTDMYDYPDQGYGAVYTTLSVLENNEAITETNYMVQNPLRVAVLEQAETRRGELKEYFSNIGAEYKEVLCQDMEEQTQALLEGRADAMLRNSLSFVKGTRQVAQFAPKPYYLITTKGNTEIISKQNEAIRQVNGNYPYFQTRLFQKYFGDSSGGFLLTEDEKKYLETNHTIHALYMVNDAPYSEDRDGTPTGILVSVLEDYASAINAKIEYTPVSSLEQLQEYKDSPDQYDCVLGALFCMDTMTRYGMVTTNTLFNADVKQYYKRGTTEKPLEESVVALHKGCGLEKRLGNVKAIRLYDSVEECLQAVNSGECDTGFADYYSLKYAMDQNNILCTTASYQGKEEEIQIYMLNTGDLRFLSIINRYINSLDDSEIYTYINENSKIAYHQDLQYFIHSNPIAAGATIALIGVLVCFLIVMMIFMRKLRLANRKLEVASSAKSAFLSRVSHDMRTPLNGILGMAGLMKEKNDVEELHSDLENIVLSGQYLLRLVNDTLDMNRIESGSLNVKKEPVKCHDVFQNVVMQSQILADERNIRFIADAGQVEGEAWTVILSDQERLEQILMNVISNAIKYTSEGGTVEFQRKILENDGHFIRDRFVITDNGIGMSEEFLPHLFEPFHQEDRMRGTRQNGTGLGMSIVKQLVDAMGGTISVRSALNEGTQITIEIPFELSLEKEEKEKPDEVDLSVLYGKHILLCEDHPLNQKIAVALLEKKGMLITVEENGAEGMKAYEQHKAGYFSAVLMDIRMPVMDGIEATKKIRQSGKADAKTIPIIAMTANAFDDDAKECEEAGMNAHIPKPYQPDQLYEILAKYM